MIASQNTCQRLPEYVFVNDWWPELMSGLMFKHMVKTCMSEYISKYVCGRNLLRKCPDSIGDRPSAKAWDAANQRRKGGLSPNLEPLIQPKQNLVWFKNTVKATQKHWETPWNNQCKPIMANQISNSKLDLTMKHNSRTPCIFFRSPYAVSTIELYHKWP